MTQSRPSPPRYFRKQLEEGDIWVKYVPGGQSEELLVAHSGHRQLTPRELDEDVLEDLAADEFEEQSALAYELVRKKLA